MRINEVYELLVTAVDEIAETIGGNVGGNDPGCIFVWGPHLTDLGEIIDSLPKDDKESELPVEVRERISRFFKERGPDLDEDGTPLRVLAERLGLH